MAWNSLFSPRPISGDRATDNSSSPRPGTPGRGVGGEGQSSSLPPPASHLQPANEFWALKDVSFEVKQGEVVGIIGRNGAGKSTLLKILSRITEPTSGRFGVRGRVASLLEVGTGFHPELTGRENIYVSGVTLGMARAEIRKRFEEIVDFSGVEKFLDTPVKHYSSGMQVRLGFAVASQLSSEILIVDEVLAVGDSEFQSRCLATMRSVSNSGRTVLFVSHNMTAIRSLCSTAMLLLNGQVAMTNECDLVVKEYLAHTAPADDSLDFHGRLADLPSDPLIRIEELTITQMGERRLRFGNGEPIKVGVTFQILQRTTGLRLYFDLTDETETLIARTFHDENENHAASFRPGRYISNLVIPENFLAPRDYLLVMRAGIFNDRCCFGGNCISISLSVETTGEINRAYSGDPVRSLLQPRFYWDTREVEVESC